MAGYYVYNSLRGGAPNIVHKTKKDAEDEAKRLAQKHPGDSFLILRIEKEVVHHLKYAARREKIADPPANHGRVWSDKEKNTLSKEVDILIKRRAGIHKRTIQSIAWAIGGYLKSEGVGVE